MNMNVIGSEIKNPYYKFTFPIMYNMLMFIVCLFLPFNNRFTTVGKFTHLLFVILFFRCQKQVSFFTYMHVATMMVYIPVVVLV